MALHGDPTRPFVAGGYQVQQSIHSAATAPEVAIGTRGVTYDGRVFYYGKHVGAGFGIGLLSQQAAIISGHEDLAWSAGGFANTDHVTITMATTATTANQYAGGTLAVIDGTGSGQMRWIKGHPAAGASDTLKFTIHGVWETTIPTGAELQPTRNQYDSFIITPGNVVKPMIVGVPQCVVPAGSTDPQYVWLQTWGLGMVQGDGSTFTLGCPLVPSSGGTGDTGQVTLGNESAGTGTANDPSDLLPVVGYLAALGDAASDLDFRLADFQIRA